MKKFLFCLIVLFASQVSAETLVIRGSDTLGDEMVPALAKAYQSAGNSVKFDIVAEGSSAAFDGLLAGASVGLSSRPIKDSEKKKLSDAGMVIKEHVAGIDMIAVIVNEQSSVGDVSLGAIKKIFVGEAGTWKTLPGAPPVKAFTRNESSGTFKVFQKLAMNGDDYGPKTVKCAGNGEIAENVASNPGGVGYVGLSYVDAKGVKALNVDGISPDPANASTYPLARKLYYYTVDGKTSPEAMAFLKWAMTDPEAAKIISKVGFIAP